MLTRLSAPWLRLPPNLRGILWILMGTLAFALNDVVVKSLGQTMTPFQLAFFRYALGLAVMAPVFWRMGAPALRTSRPGIHAARLAVACVAQVGVFTAVVHLPLADATALAFSRILFTTVVAVIVLREAVDGRRWTATAAGFAGVVVMVRPGGDIDPVALVAVGSAFMFAVANVMIRLMATTEPPNRILFLYQAGGALVFLAPTVWLWEQPATALHWGMAAAIGLLTSLGMLGFIRGFAVGEASVIGPIEYVRLIFAAGLGLAVFGEVPDAWTVAGALVIVASTALLARAETARRGGRRRAPP